MYYYFKNNDFTLIKIFVVINIFKYILIKIIYINLGQLGNYIKHEEDNIKILKRNQRVMIPFFVTFIY